MGSALCGHINLYFFDTELVVFGWRTGSGNRASSPVAKTLVLTPEDVGNEGDKGRIRQRIEALTGRKDFEVLEVRPVLDPAGKTRSFEVDIR